jgi:heptosyltransferase-3
MASATSEQIPPAGRVLVIFPGALGDLVCLGPALRALAGRHRDAKPGATLELMAREELARFAVDRIGITRIEVASGDSPPHARTYSRAYSRAYSIDRREVAALFAADADLTKAAEFFRPFTRIYSFFASDDARFRRALEKAAAPGAVSFHAFRPAGAGHVAAGYLGEIGERGAPLDGHIEVLAGDLAEARQALARLGLGGARVVLLFPGSGGAHKNWPADNFATLASALRQPLRALAVLGPAEAALEPLFSARGIAWLRDQPLSTVAGLARLAAGFAGNDSGVSHLAAAAGAPGVVLFGPTDPDRWRPLGRVKIIRALPLSDLTPDAVAAALKEIS